MAEQSNGVEPYYQDDAVTIYCGDCREIIPALARESVDLLLTDPPYGINYVSGRGAHQAMKGDDGSLDVPEILSVALRSLKRGRHFYVFGPFDLAELTHGATCALVWDEGKHGAGALDIPWGNSWEPITFGVWCPYPSEKGFGAGLVRRRRGTVLRYPTVNSASGSLDHPTRKPVPLLRELIEVSTRHDELILDPFMGSGSTLEAARLEGRRAIGIEIEERYCEFAAAKFSQGVLNLWGAA